MKYQSKQKAFNVGSENSLYLRNLEFESKDVTMNRIKNDTIEIYFEDNNFTKRILFFN
jgi:hypothetical protein